MLDLDDLNEVAKKLSLALPPSLKDAQADLCENFKAILQANLAKLNLVTRDEFDKQTALLQKAREKLNQLEAELAAR